jgi:hypothetical protein
MCRLYNLTQAELLFYYCYISIAYLGYVPLYTDIKSASLRKAGAIV